MFATIFVNPERTVEYQNPPETSRDEFLALVWHELRTLTAAILGWAELLTRSRSDSETVAHGIETIKRNAQIQAEMIEHLIDFSRIRMDDYKLDFQKIVILTTLQGAIESMMPQMLAKGIKLETRLDPASGWILADALRLHQVFTNLLSNAIKFTPSGGSIRVLLAVAESSIDVQVCDTGKGIPADLLPHIFDGPHRRINPISTDSVGLGLGLPISRHLIERHGGSIEAFSSGEGKGATFTVHLPRLTA